MAQKATESRPCVFITGAATGIGRAAARLFCRRGWFVGLADIDDAGLVTLGNELGEGNALKISLNVKSPDEWRAALTAFHDHTGRLDVLVNNAGILISGPFEVNPLERHYAVVDVNLKGVLNAVTWPSLIWHRHRGHASSTCPRLLPFTARPPWRRTPPPSSPYED